MNNPYAKKMGKKPKMDEDLYEFEGTSSSDAQNLIAATVSNMGLGHTMGGAGAHSALAPVPQETGFDYVAPSMRPPTQMYGGAPGGAGDGPRPMTSVKGAGYSSAPSKERSVFDPFQQAAQGPAPPLVPKSHDSPEHQAKDMEKAVNKLIEESAMANLGGDLSGALEKAKEAGKKERLLCKHREKNNLADQINFDLTYAVCFNLANQYASNGMYTEALNTYSIVVKNKQYPQAGRLRVNMGNIYYQQKKYPAAIKMYRMAMDQIGSTSKEMKFKIMRNIGSAFVRLGQFQDAIHSYEAIMDQAPDAQTGFNLIICYYALGDRDKMKKGFMQLLGVPELQEDDEEEEEEDADKEDARVAKVLVNDELRQEKRDRRKVTNRYLYMAARLIAPVIEKDLSAGFDWVIEHLKAPKANQTSTAADKQGFPHISMEMEIAKGIAFLKRRQIAEAIEVFKGFEKKDSGCLDQAATNLSFLYFLEGDLKNSEKYADLAVKKDRYNAKALVNKANYLYVKGDLESAKELYLEAIGVEADCVEAIYNLGLTNKRLNNPSDALQAFKKLHRIVPKDPQVIYHIGNLYEALNDNIQAAHWFTTLHGMVPSDPKVLARLGQLYTKEDDETQAFHNFSDSYNCYPVNMEVISWLGVWYVKSELYEDAIQFFERAAEIEPAEVKWQLMVASCYRRMNNLQMAAVLYKKIHRQDPDNIECLRYLCAISKDNNERDYEEYSKLLRKAERNLQSKDTAAGMMKGDERAEMQHGGGAGGPMETPSVSPSQTARGLDGKQRDLAEKFGANQLTPSKQGPTINSGKGNDADEWGDGDLGDELLPL